MLAKYSISAKLFAIVSFLFVVIATIGGFSFMQMRAINAAAQDIQAEWLPSVRWIGEMRVQSARYRAVLRDHLIVADPERADVDKNLAARKADFEKSAESVPAIDLLARGAATCRSAGKPVGSLRQRVCRGAGVCHQGRHRDS